MSIRDLILDRLETSISEFCREINVSRKAIYNILNGVTNKPNRKVTVAVCKYFNVDFKEYL